jgi:hypothetical protein
MTDEQAKVNPEETNWHEQYLSLDADSAEIVDRAFTSCVDELHRAGMSAAADGAAETLIAAITRYMVTSQGSQKRADFGSGFQNKIR